MPSTAPSLGQLTSNIPTFFQEAQHSLANHRKNAAALHRIHAHCASVQEETNKGAIKLTGEKAFNTTFLDCLNRILPIKKGVVQADRALKFVTAYITYSQAHFRTTARKEAGMAEGNQDDDDEPDTPATRFVSILLKHVVKGFVAKNKNVRVRCCQTVAILVNGLEAIDDDLYEILLNALLIRIRDKEASVRVQAIVALAKLQSGEDEELDDDDNFNESAFSKSILQNLVNTARTDPNAEVRRAALFNFPINTVTIPYILERLLDIDATNRRCVYAGSLNGGPTQKGPVANLSSEQSHQVIKTGLGEREENVYKACKKLINAWTDRDGGNAAKLLDRFDGLTYPDSTMSALKSAFETRPILLDSVSLDDGFWANLTPNTALLARTVVEYLKSQGRVGEARLEELMPLVMALAFRMQAVWSGLVQLLTQRVEGEEAEDVAACQASILDSLLHLALNSDYGDEIGRRKMFTLIREIISHPLLPRTLIEPCTDVLLKLSAGQRDFVRIVVEIVQELGDEYDDDEEEAEGEDVDEAEVEGLVQGPTSSRRRSLDQESEDDKAERRASSDSRRLLLVRAMLERMASNLHENTAIHGLIPQLIAPAVRSKDGHVREQGLFCLGLCCLLDAKLALDTFPLFLDQIQRAEGSIKLRATQVVFDCMLVHGIRYLCSRQAEAVGGGPEAEALAYSQIIGFLLGLLEDDDEPIQAVAAEGMAKLMLAGMVEDDEALRSLVLVYMSPESLSNQEMRQCLNYFLPVYCFSSSSNQRKLQRVLVPVLQVLTEVYYEVGEEREMVAPLQIGSQLIDWTDPSKVVNLAAKDRCLHFDIAIDLLQFLFSLEAKEERKTIVQLLHKLTLPEAEHLDAARGKTLFLLCAKLKEVAPFEDTTTRNSFIKFEALCFSQSKYAEYATAARKTDLETDPDLQNLREFLESSELSLSIDGQGFGNERGGSVASCDDDGRTVKASSSRAQPSATAKKATRGKAAAAVAQQPSTARSSQGRRAKASPAVKGRSKGRGRVASSEEESEEEEEEEEDDEEDTDEAKVPTRPRTSPPPRRGASSGQRTTAVTPAFGPADSASRKTAVARGGVKTIVEEVGDEDEEDEDTEDDFDGDAQSQGNDEEGEEEDESEDELGL